MDNLKQTIQPYNVVLALYGHEHAYRHYTWQGYDVVMAPAPQIDPVKDHGETKGQPKGFIGVRFRADQMDIAHWMAGQWREHWSKSTRPAARN